MIKASHRRAVYCASAIVVGLLGSAPAWALYKIVGPDGKVSYTDRPPADQPAKQLSVDAGGGDVSTANLPYSLQQIVGKYPVVLYSSKNCTPCDAGRSLLKERGIPFSERLIETPDDSKALRSQEGSDSLPVLKVGGKTLRGLQRADWSAYLDAAGYPARSELPRQYAWPEAKPLAPPAPASTPKKAARVSPPPSPETPSQGGGNAPPGFKF